MTRVTHLRKVTRVSATVETTSPPTVAQIHAALTAPGMPFEMEEAVVRGVPLRVWKATPPHLPAVLEASRAHATRDLLVYDGPDGVERLTFEEHYRQCATLAHRLRDQYGVQKGDRDTPYGLSLRADKGEVMPAQRSGGQYSSRVTATVVQLPG